MTEVFALAETYVDELCVLDPVTTAICDCLPWRAADRLGKGFEGHGCRAVADGVEA